MISEPKEVRIFKIYFNYYYYFFFFFFFLHYLNIFCFISIFHKVKFSIIHHISFQQETSGFMFRVQDMSLQDLNLLPPLSGIMSQPIVSLDEACKPLFPLVVNLGALLIIANKAGRQLSKTHTQYSLSSDECGAVWLYSCESDFYHSLNNTLRSVFFNF